MDDRDVRVDGAGRSGAGDRDGGGGGGGFVAVTAALEVATAAMEVAAAAMETTAAVTGYAGGGAFRSGGGGCWRPNRGPNCNRTLHLRPLEARLLSI